MGNTDAALIILNVMEKQMSRPKLENWSVAGNRLVGRVYGHPRYDEGEEVITSPIKEMNLQTGVAVTTSRTYDLGHSQVKEEYTDEEV